MDEGSKKYTPEQFSAELDKLGSSINFTANKQSTTIYVESLTKKLRCYIEAVGRKTL